MAYFFELPPALSCVAVIAVIFVYMTICYLAIDLIFGAEDTRELDDRGSLGLSLQELQEIASLYQKVGSDSTCVICLDNLQKAQLCRTFPACKHVFHAQCIDPWLVTRLTCPTCRAPFKAKQRLHA